MNTKEFAPSLLTTHLRYDPDKDGKIVGYVGKVQFNSKDDSEEVHIIEVVLDKKLDPDDFGRWTIDTAIEDFKRQFPNYSVVRF